MARQLVMQALYQWLLSKQDPLDINRQFHEDNGKRVDWEYFDDLFPEISKQYDVLLSHLQPHLDREAKSLDPVEQSILLLGTYELANRIDVPYRVVINECVELAKTYGATDGHKYINGVLDKLVPTLRAAEAGQRN
jgi:N utilization substance protein B